MSHLRGRSPRSPLGFTTKIGKPKGDLKGTYLQMTELKAQHFCVTSRWSVEVILWVSEYSEVIEVMTSLSRVAGQGYANSGVYCPIWECQYIFHMYRISGIQIWYCHAQRNAAMRIRTHFKTLKNGIIWAKHGLKLKYISSICLKLLEGDTSALEPLLQPPIPWRPSFGEPWGLEPEF